MFRFETWILTADQGKKYKAWLEQNNNPDYEQVINYINELRAEGNGASQPENPSYNSQNKINTPNLGVMGDLFTTFGKANVQPALMLTGEYMDEKTGSYFGFDIFAISESIDSSFSNNGTRLIMPDLATQGVSVTYTQWLNWLFRPEPLKNRAAFNLGFTYGARKITDVHPTEGIVTKQFGALNLKLGFEFALAKENFSVYYNRNYISVLQNLPVYNQYFTNASRDFWLNEVGFRGQITSTAYKGLFAEIAFNYGDHLSKVFGDTDQVAVLAKVGMRRNLPSK